MSEILFDLSSGSTYLQSEFDRELAHPRIVPLGELACAEEFNYQPGDFPVLLSRNWTNEGIVEAGKLLTKSLRYNDFDAPIISTEHLRRANILGLIPSLGTIYRRFGTPAKYIHKIEARSAYAIKNFSDMNDEEFTQYVCDQYTSMGQDSPLTMQKLAVLHAIDVVPSWYYIQTRTGGVARLNEHLGYPDIRRWEEHDYVDFGARVLECNENPKFSEETFLKLNQLSLGPHPKVITRNFGSLHGFCKLAQAKYELNLERSKRFDEMVFEHLNTHAEYPRRIVENRALARRAFALYTLIKETVSGVKKETLIRKSTGSPEHVSAFISKNTFYSTTEVEIIAHQLELSEIIWPVTNNLRLPIIPGPDNMDSSYIQ